MTLRTNQARTNAHLPSTGVSPAFSGLTLAVALTLPQCSLHRGGELNAAEPDNPLTARASTSSVHVEYDESGRPVREVCPDEGWVDHLHPTTGARVFRDMTTPSGTSRVVYDDDGILCPPFQIGGTTLHDKSEALYIREVAQRFRSPGSVARYLVTYFKYTYDTPDISKPLALGTPERSNDYWQTPQESLVRTECGNYLGDCEDLAFLAQAILREQGRTPLVLDIRNHAVCVWLEETKEGFCAHAICTAGYDRNGTVGFDEPAPHSLQTTTEALQAVMRKYERVLLGVPTGFRYDVQEDVDILAIPSVGKKLRYRAPHAALMDPLLHNDIRRHEAIALTASSAAYDELIRQHPSVPTFHLARFDALRREGVDWKDDQFREAFHRLCELRPHDPLVHENAALHHLDCNRTTNAIDHYLSAIKAGSREPTVIRQLIKLAPRLDDYIREYGTEHLNEALPALRVRAGTLGYLKDDLVLVRICAAKLGKPDEYLAVLEARAHYYGQALEELGSGRHRRDDYAAALVDLMREQVASGRIGDATATFERIRSVRGPGASMRDALPSLHHLPYREDTVALYRSILEGCPGWSGGHMELVEYLYTAGKVDQAVEELRKAIGVCKDVTALMLELKSMPGLKQHTEWPAIQSALLNRRYELRSRRR